MIYLSRSTLFGYTLFAELRSQQSSDYFEYPQKSLHRSSPYPLSLSLEIRSTPQPHKGSNFKALTGKIWVF